MKIRHAGSIALVGWYLMQPPLSLSSSHQAGFDLSKPLSEWDTFGGAFDTEAECDKEIDGMNRRAAGWAREHHTLLVLTHAQCIASDDPRLKGNPSIKGN
jgi:hypothetical protein